ncbi:MAG: hydrogenase maturation nickel metallochaperone HypA [Actinomycetota bacterium]
MGPDQKSTPNLLEAAKVEAARVGGGTLSVIGVRLGGDSGIDPDALRISFAALVDHRDLGDLSLVIEAVPSRRTCRCGEVFEVDRVMAVCPACESLESQRLPGPSLEIAFLEFDDRDASVDG